MSFERIFAIIKSDGKQVPYMFKIKYYRTEQGYCDIEEFLLNLERKVCTNKNARIQYKQVVQYIQFLSDHGTRLGENICKHLTDDIWELRPGNNRVLFFYFKNDTFVLLHHFRKKTQKTPKREIEKAIKEKNDWILRKG